MTSMSADDDATNTVEFKIELKCRLKSECALLFELEFPGVPKEKTPAVSEWSNERHQWTFSSSFTKQRVTDWTNDCILNIQPIGAPTALTVDLSSLLSGSTSIRRTWREGEVEAMQSLQIHMTLDGPIMTAKWNSDLLPFHFEICDIENLPDPTDRGTKLKPLTVQYQLPGSQRMFTSPPIERREGVDGKVEVKWSRTCLLSVAMDDVAEFIEKITYCPLRVAVLDQEPDIEVDDESESKWTVRGEAPFVLSDLFDAQCVMEQNQSVHAVFNGTGHRVDRYRACYSSMTVKYKVNAPRAQILKLLDAATPIMRSVFVLKHSELDDAASSRMKQHVERWNLEQLQKRKTLDAEHDAAGSTMEEVEDMAAGDVLSGFQVDDGEHRVLVVESKKDGHSMDALRDLLHEDHGYHLPNAQRIRFRQRIYSELDDFGDAARCGLHSVKLSNSMDCILKEQRQSVGVRGPRTRTVVDKLSELTRCGSTERARNQNLFPSTAELQTLETMKYEAAKQEAVELESESVDDGDAELTSSAPLASTVPVRAQRVRTQRAPISSIWRTSKSATTTMADTESAPRDFVREHISSWTTDPEQVEKRRMEHELLMDSVPDVMVDVERRNEVESAKEERRSAMMTDDGWTFQTARSLSTAETIKRENELFADQQVVDDEDCDRHRDGHCDDNTASNKQKFIRFTSTHSRLFGMSGNEIYWKSVFAPDPEAEADAATLASSAIPTQPLSPFRTDLRTKSDIVPIIDRFRDIALRSDGQPQPTLVSTQSVDWKYDDQQKQTAETTHCRTQLDPELFLDGEFDIVSKSEVMRSPHDLLAASTSKKAFAAISSDEKQKNQRLYCRPSM